MPSLTVQIFFKKVIVGQAPRRRGVQESPPTSTIQLARTQKKAKPSAAARPSAAEKGGSEASPDYGTIQHARAQTKAKRSGQVERSKEWGSGVSPGYGNQTCSTPKKVEPSATARPSAAEKGGSGVSSDYDTTQLARA
jgi:hypothetical protein